MKQFTFLQEGSNRILSKSKNPSDTHYISICIFYLFFTSRQLQEFKNYQITSSTSKVTSTTIFIVLLIFVLHLNFKQLGFLCGPMTQHTCQSHGNVNHMRMQKNPLPHHTMSNHIKTQTMNPKNHDMNPKNTK